MKIIGIVLCLMLTSSIIGQVRVADERGYLVKMDDQAPVFKVILADGSSFQLSDMKGKVVMLQFTASWCGVCRNEMPQIERQIWQAFKHKGLVLVGIDRDEPLETVTSFAKQTGITYPLALDPGADVFGLYADKKAGVTRNVLINRDGKIIFMTRLYNDEEFNGLVNAIAKEFSSTK